MERRSDSWGLSPTSHYGDVIMSTMASQITNLTIVYSTVYSGADQRKQQSPASLAFAWGIHRGPVNSPHKWPVTRKMFPFDDVIMAGDDHWLRRLSCFMCHSEAQITTWLILSNVSGVHVSVVTLRNTSLLICQQPLVPRQYFSFVTKRVWADVPHQLGTTSIEQLLRKLYFVERKNY